MIYERRYFKAAKSRFVIAAEKTSKVRWNKESVISTYDGSIDYIRGVQHVARGCTKSGTSALAIFDQHPTMQFFGGTQLIKKTVLRCNFNYRYIVYCCNIALMKLVSDFHSFCSSILIQDVWGVKLRCLLDHRLVLRQLLNMQLFLVHGPRWSFRWAVNVLS